MRSTPIGVSDMGFIVWNVDKAQPLSKRPLGSNRAGRLADILERRLGVHTVVVGVK